MNILVDIIDRILELYIWIIIIAAILSWVRPDPYHPIVRFLYSVTEPVFRPIRRRIGIWSGIDISPFIVILIIWLIRALLKKIIS